MQPVNHSDDTATSDLQLQHPLLRVLPRVLHPFALLSRWDRPIGVWLMLLPGLWGLCLAAPGLPSIDLLLLFFIGGWAMRGAGCTINDLLDRRLDAAVTRTAGRPLAAGSVTVTAAWVWLALQLLVGLIILLQLPATAQIFGIAAVPLILVYPLMKRITWWPQAWLGLTFNWGIWIGAAVYTVPVSPVTFLLYAGAICWTLGYDTIYAVQDRADDALVGVKSTARLWGEQTLSFVNFMYVFALLFWLAAGAFLPLGYLLGWGAASILTVWLLRGWQPGNLLSARRAFMRNQYIGLALLVGILLTKL